MANTSDIKKGLCMDYNHDIWVVTDFQHVKPGKGNAFVRTTLKSMTTGKVVDNTFPAGHKINQVRVERRKFQFLYSDDMGFHFMNNETFEQTSLQEALIPNSKILKEGSNIDVIYHAEKDMPLTVELPQYITLEITYTEPGVKGDTATNSTKPATVETGAEIRVPLFINTGDSVKIDTKDCSYVERVKT